MYHIKKEIADFDACGVYPSAMYFMDGFLEGLPKALNNTSVMILQPVFWYHGRSHHDREEMLTAISR